MKQKLIEYLAGLNGTDVPFDLELCEYNSNCTLAEYRKHPVCFKQETENCRAYRFYKRYEKWYKKDDK